MISAQEVVLITEEQHAILAELRATAPWLKFLFLVLFITRSVCPICHHLSEKCAVSCLILQYHYTLPCSVPLWRVYLKRKHRIFLLFQFAWFPRWFVCLTVFCSLFLRSEVTYQTNAVYNKLLVNSCFLLKENFLWFS